MAASEALSLGYGGVSRIRRASGLSRKAIAKGIREIADGNTMPGRIRRSGAGRKSIVARDPKLLVSLDRLIEPETRGDPESPLRWICKSTRNLAAQLTRQKHPVSHEKVAQLLRDQNYSLQSNRKTEEGADHPDRDAQFRHINAQVKRALATGMPVISVDTKKKELLGNYANSGQQWLPAKKPVKVNFGARENLPISAFQNWPRHFDLSPRPSTPTRGDHEASPCQRPGRDRARSAAGGSGRTRVWEIANMPAGSRNARPRAGRRPRAVGAAGTRATPSPGGSIGGRHKRNRRPNRCGYPRR